MNLFDDNEEPEFYEDFEVKADEIKIIGYYNGYPMYNDGLPVGVL